MMRKGKEKKNTINKKETMNVQDYRIFVEIGKTLTSVLSLNGVLNTIMEKVGELFDAKNWSLLLLDENTNELKFEISVGLNYEKLKSISLKVGEGIAGWVAEHQTPAIIENVAKDPRWTPKIDKVTNFKTKSIIAVPLISKGKVLGVIELINLINKKKKFTEENMILFQAFADYAAIAIENAKYLQKIEELTIKDDVTGLYNSRYLHKVLEQEFKRAQRYGEHFSLIFIDLDYFKLVNDTYGHLIGSQLLKEVGTLITNTIRESDIATRYGGDEFVLILPETTKENAYRVAVRLRERINSTTFISNNGVNIRITASFGIATYPTDTVSKDELITLSDQAMYRVKETTRDGIALV